LLARDPAVGGAELARYQLQPFRALELALAALQQAVGIVRLDPGLQELDGHGGTHGASVEDVEFQRWEPALVDVCSEPRAQHGAHLFSYYLAVGSICGVRPACILNINAWH